MKLLRAAPLAVAVLASALLLGAAWRCLARVPEGALGLQIRNDQGIAMLSPGRHLIRPMDSIVLLPSTRRDYSGEIHLTTTEGAALAIPFRIGLDFTRAEPSRLAALAGGPASAGGLEGSVGRLVEKEATALSAGRRESLSAEMLAPVLNGIGLVPGSLTLGRARTSAPAHGENPLRASYKAPPWPVLVIGIDSADWDLMTPMMEAGALPNLKALRDRGAWGTLRSMKPTLSPILWTTIATGRPPEEHGVIDFLMKDPATGAEVPISRFFRKVKALWNIASDLDLSNLTVAWWATWPAEEVAGQMITDRVAYSLFDLSSDDRQIGNVYPESLAREVLDLRVEEDEIGYEDLRAIADVPPAEFDRARLLIGSLEGYRDPITHLIRILASTQTYHRIATTLVARNRPGLALVYYEGLDEVNHRFAHLMPPAMKLARGTPAPLAAACAGAVSGFYRLQDRMVGDLVEAAGPDAVILVMSDHGFANGAERPIDAPPDIEGKPGLWHTLDGVFIAAGPPIAPGRLAGPLTLLDVAPTVLALLGLPKAGDMPGRALTEIVRPGLLPRTQEIQVASYDEIGAPLQVPGAGGASAHDSEMIAKLAALGYIQSGPGPGSDTGTPTYHVNAGRIFLSKNQLDRAQQEFDRARELAPGFDQPLLGLAQVQMMRGRPAEAIPLLEEALRASRDPQPALFTRAALVYMRAGRLPEGIAFLGSLRLTGAPEAFRLTALGMLRERTGDAEGALAAYRGALAIEPAISRALQGAYQIMKRKGDLEELARLLSGSVDVEVVSVSVRASNWLALTRELQGDRDRARTILQDALLKLPDEVMTLTNLGSMLVREDRAKEGLPYLERAYGRRPKSIEVLINLIVAHGRMGSLDQARRYFAEGEAVAKRPELYNAMAYACHLNGASRDAATYIGESLALDPNQAEARRLKEEIDRKGAL
ncbi:MAG TPA: alkaline phosphatase family protein [Candidatus Polarisedimenticolia bacterium]|jgi:predicted AlkP superfamily phosphohydrolase/phosphomutase/tetratricopeptide (TPR) repeat protein